MELVASRQYALLVTEDLSDVHIYIYEWCMNYVFAHGQSQAKLSPN